MSPKPEILKRFFEGKYSRKDYSYVKTFFTDDRSSQFLKEYMERHWDEFHINNSSEIDLKPLLHKIHPIIKQIEDDNT